MVEIVSLDIKVNTSDVAAASAPVDKLATSLKKLDTAVNPLKPSIQQLNEEAKKIGQTAAPAVQKFNDTLAKTVPAAEKSARAIGLNAHEMKNLSFQLNDAGTMLASGSSPFQVVATQAGQVYQILQGAGGGVNGAMKDLGSKIAGVATIGRLAAGAMAALGVAGYAAWSSWESRMQRIQIALNGIGSASGQTVSGLVTVANRAAARSGISQASAQDYAGGFANAGLNYGQTDVLTGSIKRDARAFGLSMDEVAADLAKAFKDPVRGAEELDKKFGLMTGGLRDTIALQMRAGDVEGARNSLLNAYNKALSETTDRTGLLAKGMANLGVVISDAITKIGQSLGEKTAVQKLEAQLATNAAAKKAGPAAAIASGFSALPDPFANMDRAGGARGGVQQLPDLAILETFQKAGKTDTALRDAAVAAWKVVMEEAAKAIAAQRDALAKKMSIQATDTIKEFAPEFFKKKELEAQFKQVSEALDPASDTFKHMKVSSEEAATALERLNNRIKFMQSPLQQMITDSQLSTQATLAYTAAQRIGAEMQRAYIQKMREGATALEATTAAEAARNQVLADAARQARDNLREVQNQSQLIGLNETERAFKQIEQKYRDMNQRLVPGSIATDPILAPFKSALDIGVTGLNAFTNALSAATNKMLGIGGASGSTGPGSATVSGPRELTITAPSITLKGADGLNGDFAERLAKLIAAVPGLSIGSGYRSTEQQAALYAQKGPGWAAPPGSSNHERGTAADLVFANEAAKQMAHAMAAQFGLAFPLANRAKNPEAWHVEPAEGGKRLAASGGSANRTGALNAEAEALRNKTQAELTSAQAEERSAVTKNALAALDKQGRDYVITTTSAIQAQARAYAMGEAESAAYLEKERMIAAARINATIGLEGVREKIDEVSAAMGRASTMQTNFNEALKRIDEIRGMTGDAISGFVSGLARGDSMAKTLKNTVQSLTQSLIRMATNMMMSGLFGPGGGKGGGLLSGLFSSFLGGGSGNPIGPGTSVLSAKGNVFQHGNVIPFARGGIVGSPTIFPMANGKTGLMGEAGEEAIVPLKRNPDGRLGIAASGGRQGGIQFQVINNTPARVETRSGTRPDGSVWMKAIVSEVGAAMARGEFDDVNGARYGARPRSVQR